MDYFKVLGVAFSLAGTSVLAYRVTTLLKSISMAVKFHDLNFEIEAKRAEGNRDVPNIRTYGTAKQIDLDEKLGTKLLVIGFALQILGGILNIIAMWPS